MSKQIAVICAGVGEYDEYNVKLIKAYTDIKKAEEEFIALRDKAKSYRDTYMDWYHHVGRLKLHISNIPEGMSGMEHYKQVMKTAPGQDWDLKASDGEAVNFHSIFNLILVPLVE